MRESENEEAQRITKGTDNGEINLDRREYTGKLDFVGDFACLLFPFI